MKNTAKLGILLTSVYELIVIISMFFYSTCDFPFSPVYKMFSSLTAPLYIQYCFTSYVSMSQVFLLCIVVPAFLWLAVISIRSIKYFLTFWSIYELAIVLSIYNINSCFISFGISECYKAPTTRQYILLCIVVPFVYLLLMLWKKELNKLNAYDIGHMLKDWFALPKDNENASALKKSKKDEKQ